MSDSDGGRCLPGGGARLPWNCAVGYAQSVIHRDASSESGDAEQGSLGKFRHSPQRGGWWGGIRPLARTPRPPPPASVRIHRHSAPPGPPAAARAASSQARRHRLARAAAACADAGPRHPAPRPRAERPGRRPFIGRSAGGREHVRGTPRVEHQSSRSRTARRSPRARRPTAASSPPAARQSIAANGCAGVSPLRQRRRPCALERRCRRRCNPRETAALTRHAPRGDAGQLGIRGGDGSSGRSERGSIDFHCATRHSRRQSGLHTSRTGATHAPVSSSGRPTESSSSAALGAALRRLRILLHLLLLLEPLVAAAFPPQFQFQAMRGLAQSDSLVKGQTGDRCTRAVRAWPSRKLLPAAMNQRF